MKVERGQRRRWHEHYQSKYYQGEFEVLELRRPTVGDFFVGVEHTEVRYPDGSTKLYTTATVERHSEVLNEQA